MGCEDIKELIDISKLGAIVTKTITLNKRKGNPPPRVVETAGGLLNSIGLDNDGLKDFMFEKISLLEEIKMPVIVSIAGDNIGEFVKLAEEISKVQCVSGIEVNLSCPNVVHKGTKFSISAQDKKATKRIILRVRKKTEKTLIAKLSPHVTNIKEIAKEKAA